MRNRKGRGFVYEDKAKKATYTNMRQRSIDVNQTTVFVDTQPRPVNCVVPKRRLQKPQGGRWPNDGGGGGDQMTEGRAWSLLGLAMVLLLGGTYLVRGNHYAHLHRQIQEAYYTYLQEWDGGVRDSFAATHWELHVQGLDHPLPLQPRSWPSKRVPAPNGNRNANSNSSGNHYWGKAVAGEATDVKTSAAGADQEVQGGGDSGGQRKGRGRGRRRAAAQSTLLEFRLVGLLDLLHPAHVPPLDRHKAVHSRLWRPVGPELRRPAAMALRGRDPRTGAEWEVNLGTVMFTRERTVPAGGEGRCMYEEHGVWQEDGTCSVHEYLWGLCVKVARNVTTETFSVDKSTGGGPGCGPEWGWEMEQWRRMDERRHSINGRVYLPVSARNATVVTVRHARDPAILESDLVRRLAPGVEQQILFHAVGLAMCFLGLVLLLSMGAFAAPTLLRRGQLLWSAMLTGRQRWRRGGGSGDEDGEEEAAMRRVDGFRQDVNL